MLSAFCKSFQTSSYFFKSYVFTFVVLLIIFVFAYLFFNPVSKFLFVLAEQHAWKLRVVKLVLLCKSLILQTVTFRKNAYIKKRPLNIFRETGILKHFGTMPLFFKSLRVSLLLTDCSDVSPLRTWQGRQGASCSPCTMLCPGLAYFDMQETNWHHRGISSTYACVSFLSTVKNFFTEYMNCILTSAALTKNRYPVTASKIILISWIFHEAKNFCPT